MTARFLLLTWALIAEALLLVVLDRFVPGVPVLATGLVLIIITLLAVCLVRRRIGS
jgi:hypothetical protein